MPAQLPPLLPEPARSRARKGRFALDENVPIVLGREATDADFASARVLAARVREASGLALPIESHARAEDLGARIELKVLGIVGETHRIEVKPDGVRVEADGPAGLRWAVETVGQLVDPRGRIPACRIEDEPRFAHRGVMLDVCRGKVPTADCLRELIDRLARLKLNVLMLHQEHTFRFRRHPEIGAGDSPMDAETLREVDAYAAANHVEFIPCLQSLGHMAHVLGLERYAHLAESAARWTISPADPGTYELLGDLYDEYLPNFRSTFFNANCDEPWDLEKGRSEARGRELGPGGVYLEHVRRVRDLAAERGKRTMIWGDVVHHHPGRIPEIDRDLVLLDWWYEAEHDYDRVKVFAENGIDFWVCPGTSSWNCLFPRMDNALRNISGYAAAGRRHGAKGLLVTDWGDFGHYNLLGNSWLGYAWAAQEAWSGPAAPARFDRAFSALLFPGPPAQGRRDREAARIYRDLGAVHDVGYTFFNGSPLQMIFFEDVGPARFSEAAKPGALRRCHAALSRVEARLAAHPDAFGDDALTRDEVAYALDASLLAVRKAAAARSWVAWRRRPESLRAADRRRLARELDALAGEQVALGRTLRRLWLARSEISNFAATKKRLDTSVRSLRAASRALAANRPTEPPPAGGGVSFQDAFVALRESTGLF
jgi:hypothetical protein